MIGPQIHLCFARSCSEYYRRSSEIDQYYKVFRKSLFLLNHHQTFWLFAEVLHLSLQGSEISENFWISWHFLQANAVFFSFSKYLWSNLKIMLRNVLLMFHVVLMFLWCLLLVFPAVRDCLEPIKDLYS